MDDAERVPLAGTMLSSGAGAGGSADTAIAVGDEQPAAHFFAPHVKTYSRLGSSAVHSGVAGPVVALGRGARAPSPVLASAGPLGLTAFAGTTFLFSLANLRAGFAQPDVGLGMAFFFGGLAQLIAGHWEFVAGNTFGATAFTAYGAFWLSYGYLATPATGSLAAYDGDAAALRAALGSFMLSWSVFTWIMTMAAHRTNAGLMLVFVLTSFSFPLLAAGAFSGSVGLSQAGGGVGVAAALCAWYTALSGLLTPQTSRFTLPNPKL